MIRRIRKVLGLKAQGAAMRIRLAAFAGDRPIQEISGVELNARLIGQYLQHAPAAGLVDLGRLRQFATIIKHPIVIVTVAFFQLIVVVVNSCAHSGGFLEVERRSTDRGQLSGWN